MCTCAETPSCAGVTTPFKSMTFPGPKLSSPSKTVAGASLTVHTASAKSRASSFAGSLPTRTGLFRKLRYVQDPAKGLLTGGSHSLGVGFHETRNGNGLPGLAVVDIASFFHSI